MDVDGSPTSGSLRLETRISNGAADGPLQCVDAGPGFYDAVAWVLNPTQSPQPQSFIAVDYYPAAACFGAFSDSDTVFWSGTLDVWDEIAFLAEAPAGTASIGLRLFSGNTVDATPVAVFFDAVFLPEPAGPLGTALAVVSIAALARHPRRARRGPPRSPVER